MAAYLVNKTIRMLGTGLERQPGQHVSDADFRTCPGWRDALLAEGAIVEHTPTAPTATVKSNGFGEPLAPPMTPVEQRRRKRGA